MRLRTVRLDQNSESALQDIIKLTGLPASEIFRESIIVYKDRLTEQQPKKTPYEIYLSLGDIPGSKDIPPASESRKNVQKILNKKLKSKTE